MALRWAWENKIGELDIQQGEHKFTLSLYQGNALLIMLHEREESYTMYNFFADKTHFKNCQKDKDWNYCEEWVELRLWKKPSADLWMIIEDIVNRGVNVQIVAKPKEDKQ